MDDTVTVRHGHFVSLQLALYGPFLLVQGSFSTLMHARALTGPKYDPYGAAPWQPAGATHLPRSLRAERPGHRSHLDLARALETLAGNGRIDLRR